MREYRKLEQQIETKIRIGRYTYVCVCCVPTVCMHDECRMLPMSATMAAAATTRRRNKYINKYMTISSEVSFNQR